MFSFQAISLLLLAWAGSYLIRKERLERSRSLLWLIFLSFPLPYIAILTGWFTAEVGRQPWAVYGLLRTVQAVTPTLTSGMVLVSLCVFCVVYALIFVFGVIYIHKLLRTGPQGRLITAVESAATRRPMAIVDGPLPARERSIARPGTPSATAPR